MEKLGGHLKRESQERSTETFESVRQGLMRLLLGVAAYGTVAATEVPSADAKDLVPKVSRSETIAKTPQQRISPEQAFIAAKERILNDTVSVTKHAIAQKDFKDAMQWRSLNPVSDVLRAIELPILPAHLEGTKYDVSQLQKNYTLQLSSIPVEVNKTIVHRDAEVLSSMQYATHASFQSPLKGRTVANGFYYGNGQTIITNEHVAASLPGGKVALRNDTLDISVANASAKFQAAFSEQIIHDNPSVTDADIEGSLVVAVGIDPDASSDHKGGKVYPGVAVKIPQEFAEGYFSRNIKQSKKPEELQRWKNEIMKMSSSYMIVLPPGEGREMFPKEFGKIPAVGMSGSAVFGYIRGQYQLTGIVWGVTSINDTARGRNVDVAYFHPISAIRQIANQAKAWELK